MMFNIKSLNVHLNNKHILKDINLEICKNEFVAILGKSGSGKSVLLNTLLGNLPFSGTIEIDGNSVGHIQIGIAFQNFNILPWLTLRQNISLVTRDIVSIEKYAKLFGILKYLDYYPSKVSKGTAQRASIIRSLVTPSNIIFLDEPLCSVDYLTAMEIRSELKEAVIDKTILYVTHDLNEAMDMAHRIVCINTHGRIGLNEEKLLVTKDQILESVK